MRAFYVYLPILYYFSALDLVWAFIDFEIKSSAIDAIYFNFFLLITLVYSSLRVATLSLLTMIRIVKSPFGYIVTLVTIK